LNDVNGDASVGDIVIFRNAVVEGNKNVKPGILGFGQQFTVLGSCPTDSDDMGTLVAAKFFLQR
jgi:hypothetical protein